MDQTDQKLKKIEGILSLADQDYVTGEEIEQVFEGYTEIITNIKNDLESKIGVIDIDLKDELTNRLKNLEKSFKSAIEKTKKDSLLEINKAKSEMSQCVMDMKNLMPKEFDPTEITQQIERVERDIVYIEKKIPIIPDEITGEKIVQKINDLPVDNPDYFINPEHIKDFDKHVKKLLPTSNITAGIVGRDIIQDIDISSQFDGVTKTFNIQAVWRIVSVDLSSYPYGSCRKNIDYTWTPTSITFTSQIDAASQLASGQTCILTVVTG